MNCSVKDCMHKKNKSGRSVRRKTRKMKGRKPNMVLVFISKLELGRLSVSEKINRARRIVSMMTGNPLFPLPIPALADIVAATDALELAQEALPGTKAQTIERNLRESELDELLITLQRYVEFIANGDKVIVLSSGMEVRDPNSPVGILAAPSDFNAVSTRVEGQIKLDWKAVKKRTSYAVEWTTNPDEGQPFNAECTKSKMTLNGLEPGVRYYFRVATISAAGTSGYTPWIYCRPN